MTALQSPKLIGGSTASPSTHSSQKYSKSASIDPNKHPSTPTKHHHQQPSSSSHPRSHHNSNSNNNSNNNNTNIKHHHHSTPTHHQKNHPPSSSDTKSSPNSSSSPHGASHPENSISKKSSSKVSHVICKFYKAGNCSAGTSCQFSHTLPELGQGKPVCQWFVKGNCRFAHKCALAHILPGQPMSMDRKNKRAAQAAAREAAAASASEQIDISFPASPPPELTLELVDDENHHSNPSPTKIVIAEPIQSSINSLTSPELIHRSRQLLRSPKTLLNDLELETSNQSDDLQFGLPDDFTNSDPPLQLGSSLSPSRHHANNLFPHPFHQTIMSDTTPNPFSDHNPYHQHHQHHHQHHLHHRSQPAHSNNRLLSATPQRNGITSERHHIPISIDRARAWPRDASPTPFGAGSPFSAPGSRSIFLPRIGSFGSDDGYPRSAPSLATSPNQNSHLANMTPAHEDDLWDEVEVNGDEEDVTELLPSSLHSLLTPAERHRQHIRKHAPHTLYSRSVPVEDIIGTKLKKQAEPSALRNGFALSSNSLSVSPAPGFRHSASNETIHQHSGPFRRETSDSGLARPQSTTYLSSSYLPPTATTTTTTTPTATPFSNWQQPSTYSSYDHHPSNQPVGQTLSPPIGARSPKNDLLRSVTFEHAPGTSLPQGLAAGLSRLHFQPPLPTGLTPYGSPSGTHSRDHLHHSNHPLSPPRSPPSMINPQKCLVSSPLSQRMAGLNFGSTTVNQSSPLSRNVSCSPGPNNNCVEDDDTPFRLEM